MSVKNSEGKVFRFKAGSPCWLLIDDTGNPSGFWRGEIIKTNLKDEEMVVQVKLIDIRLLYHPNPEYRAYYNNPPEEEGYMVIPTSDEIDGLCEFAFQTSRYIELLDSLQREKEEELESVIRVIIGLAQKMLAVPAAEEKETEQDNLLEQGGGDDEDNGRIC